MRKLSSQLLDDEKGSVIVETPMAIVLIMCLFLGGIYFFSAYRSKIVMEMAAKEGSRQYQVTHNISNTYKELEIGNVSGASVTTTGSGVLITKKLAITMPIVGNYQFNLKASANFRKENKVLYYNK